MVQAPTQQICRLLILLYLFSTAIGYAANLYSVADIVYASDYLPEGGSLESPKSSPRSTDNSNITNSATSNSYNYWSLISALKRVNQSLEKSLNGVLSSIADRSSTSIDYITTFLQTTFAQSSQEREADLERARLLAASTSRLMDEQFNSQRTPDTARLLALEAIAFSPDGHIVVTASNDGTARLWNATTGLYNTTLRGHTASVRSIAFSPDGRLLAAGSDDSTTLLWDVATRKSLTTLQGHTAPVRSIAFSPDGRLLAAGFDDGTTQLWDVAARKSLTTLQGHTAPVRSIAFSRDGEIFMTASNDGITQVWNVASSQSATSHQDRLSIIKALRNNKGTGAIISQNRLWAMVNDLRAVADNLRSEEELPVARSSTNTRLLSVLSTSNASSGVHAIWSNPSGLSPEELAKINKFIELLIRLLYYTRPLTTISAQVIILPIVIYAINRWLSMTQFSRLLTLISKNRLLEIVRRMLQRCYKKPRQLPQLLHYHSCEYYNLSLVGHSNGLNICRRVFSRSTGIGHIASALTISLT
jgi:WD40 repeat protein